MVAQRFEIKVIVAKTISHLWDIVFATGIYNHIKFISSCHHVISSIQSCISLVLKHKYNFNGQPTN